MLKRMLRFTRAPQGKERRGDSYKNLVRVNYTLGAIGIALLTAIFTLYILADSRGNRAAEEEKLRQLSVASAARFESLVDNLLVTMRFADLWISEHPREDPLASSQFRRMFAMVETQFKGMVSFGIADDFGNAWDLPGENGDESRDGSGWEFFKESKQTGMGNLFFGVPDLAAGRPELPVTYRLKNNPRRLFILFARIPFSALDGLISADPTLPGGSVALLRSDNTLLYRNPYDPDLVGQVFPRSGKDGVVALAEIRTPVRMRRLVTTRSVEGFTLTVVVGEDYDGLSARWLSGIALKSVIALAIVTLYSFLTLRTIASVKRNNEIQRILQTAARYDSLTGLKNRGYFFERFSDELERAERYGLGLVFMILDIDHFKALNDTYGHPEGDGVLKKIAGIIEAGIRNSDLSGRVGGEEFAVILTDIDLVHGIPVAERIRERVTAISVGKWKAGISVGAVAWKGAGESLTDLYKRADAALYRAKEEGRNRVVAGSS